MSVGEGQLWFKWYCQTAKTYFETDLALTRSSSDTYPMNVSTSSSLAGSDTLPSSSKNASHLPT